MTSGSTGYYETFTASTRTFGTAASGAYKATDDIYTKVTFSEDMKQTVGTDGTAKPVIKYSIAGTETQYEIVAQGTGSLASGKCRPNHATETDEYVCRYTVASGNTGAFKVIVDTGSTDIATNALASKYTHGTSLTLDTTVPTVGTNTITTSNSNSSYAKQSDTITITIDFSEEIDESNTTIKYQIGAGTETDFTYTTNATIASGQCKETTDSTDIYTCKYTVGSSDNGLFKVKVSAFKDMAGNAGTAQTYNTSGVTTDTTAPTVSYSVTNTGGNASNSKHYLNASDTVTAQLTFSETMQDVAPTVQFKNDSTNLGSAITATSASTPAFTTYTSSPAGSQSVAVADTIDLGLPTGAGLTQEDVTGAGKVYKTTKAFTNLYIEVDMEFNTGVAFKARKGATKPTATTVATAGAEITGLDNIGTANTVVAAGANLGAVASGTYIWFYHSDTTNSRTVTERHILVAELSSSTGAVLSENGSVLTGSDTGGASDPFDFGTPTDSRIAREALGSGYVYKTTKPLHILVLNPKGNYTALNKSFKARWAATAPTTPTLNTHGTELFSVNSDGVNAVNAYGILTSAPTDTYIWFYTTETSMTLSSRDFNIYGLEDVQVAGGYNATYTVGSGVNVADGDLKYDITNESSLKDLAGNVLATVSDQTVSGYVIDTTPPVAPTTDGLDLCSNTTAPCTENSDSKSTVGSVTAGTDTDDITNDTTPMFKISGWTDGADADTGTDSITLYLGNDSKGTSTGITGNTAVAITASTTNANANCTERTFSAKTKDRAGNESTTAATLGVTIKAASCIDKPTTTDAIILNAGDDTGVSNTDQHTNATSATV